MSANPTRVQAGDMQTLPQRPSDADHVDPAARMGENETDGAAAGRRCSRGALVTASRWAMLVLIVHVVVESYVDVRPGVHPSDHLVSGLVPSAVVALLAFTLDRCRPGGLAAVDVLLGAAAVIGGAAAPMAALARGEVHPATITGSLATVAGGVLIGVGSIAGITSRRRVGRRGRRWARRAATFGVMVLAAFFVSAPIGLGYAVAHRSGPVRAVSSLGAPHDVVTLRTRDGLVLTGGYVPSRNGAAVILFPGVSGENVTSRAAMLSRHGYGVLVLEPRGNGASEGDPNLLGWSGEADIVAALDFLEARHDVAPGRVAGLGLSVGGELMLQAAAHDDRLAVVLSEGAGTRSVGEDLGTPFPARFVQVPFSTVATLATAVFSDSLPPARLGDLVGDIRPRPILLMFASPGRGGEWFNPDYQRLAGPSASIWEIPGSDHVGGLRADPAEYERRVISFLDAALG